MMPAPTIKILDVSGMPPSWDAADALAEGWTPEQALKWAKARAVPLTPEKLKAMRAKLNAENEPTPAASPSPVATESDSWPKPQPLSARVEPEPYPLDALPATIQAAVEEVLDRKSVV